MSKKQSVIKKITQWKVILGLQVLASLIFIAFVFKLGALPIIYATIIIVILVLVGTGTFFLMKPNEKKGKGKKRNIVGKVVSILLSILILVGTLYIAQGDSAISAITGANKQITRISIVVKNESKYQKLSDLKNQTIETNKTLDPDKIAKVLEELKKEDSSIKTQDISDVSKLSDDLYSGKTEAILVNETWNSMLEVNHGNFQSETREIWSFEIEEEVSDISKNVNVTKEAFVVYISGIDTRGKVSTVSRSDVNMIVTVNPKTKQILMTSIPRDYYVTLANKGEKDKLTHSGLAGIENTVKTVENFMDIDINYYARVNFTSLIKMVDALGGIEMNVQKSFTSSDKKYQFKKGIMKLNGEQALSYSRERSAFGGGDNARVGHQQEVLTAMLKKMMSPSIITNYSSVLNSISGSFETNMSSKEITDLLQMQISDMASWTFIQKQLEETGKMMTGGAYMPNNKLWYGVPVESSVAENKQAIKDVIAGKTVK